MDLMASMFEKLNVTWTVTGDTVDLQCRWCGMETHYTHAASHDTIVEDSLRHFESCPGHRERLEKLLGRETR